LLADLGERDLCREGCRRPDKAAADAHGKRRIPAQKRNGHALPLLHWRRAERILHVLSNRMTSRAGGSAIARPFPVF
jgi:hypothetical protein